jgi:hypothetical protein
MKSDVRVGGSNYTTFQWNGATVAYLERIVDSGQQPVGQGMAEIHPLGQKYPLEFAVPNALTGGRLTLTVDELWNKSVWQHLNGLESANDLLDVWTVFRANAAAITCKTIVKPPNTNYWRTKTYHNIVIIGIDDGETIEIGTMQLLKNITAAYTHSSRAVVPQVAT